VRLAVLAEDVRLPVVEVELGRRADLLLGLVGVLDVGQRDVDLVGARPLDLGLRDAELVDALAHDVDRPVDGVPGDLAEPRRLGLVDERHAALQVEAQAGRLRGDDHDGGDEQPGDEEQDEEVATTVVHGDEQGRVLPSVKGGPP
jgi:hypothetical protein